MVSHNNGGEYFQELVIAPVCVVFFKNKVMIIERTGDVIERALVEVEPPCAKQVR